MNRMMLTYKRILQDTTWAMVAFLFIFYSADSGALLLHLSHVLPLEYHQNVRLRHAFIFFEFLSWFNFIILH